MGVFYTVLKSLRPIHRDLIRQMWLAARHTKGSDLMHEVYGRKNLNEQHKYELGGAVGIEP